MKKTLIITLCSTIILLASYTPLEIRDYRVRTIVIDAGHGGKDPGCLGANAREKDIALDIALKLGELIQHNIPDVKVIYTRKDDNFIELHERAGIANRNNADLFISIHVNSGPVGQYGTETYCMGLHKTESNLAVAQRENSSILMEKDKDAHYDGFDPSSPQSYIMFSLYQSANMNNSMALASKVEGEFQNTLKRKSRGVKQAGFLVLWKTTMPAILIETGFITDTTDSNVLTSETERMNTAWGIYTAVETYKMDMEDAAEEE